MISVKVDTAPAIARLDETKLRLRAAARNAVESGANRLLSLVQEKLSGEVLNSRSSALLRSIRVETAEDTDGIAVRVLSDGSVPYARIQEYGGRVNIPALEPIRAKALAFGYGGKLVFAKSTAAHVVDIPERSYMRLSLAEFARAFSDEMREAIAGSLA
ncbi:MAG TPA: HK97 gp10 family phage protein [Rhizomicrobium sp.]|nr:HK97 gp10 family phage protein [Rhizomicrobium sp.]